MIDTLHLFVCLFVLWEKTLKYVNCYLQRQLLAKDSRYVLEEFSPFSNQ